METNWTLILTWVIIIIGIITFFVMYVIPSWNVWASRKEGEAQLAQAKNEEMIQVSKADGRLRAAEANKKAAVIEAEAVAKQIEVIGNNLQKHDLYLRWQWIKMMEDNEKANTIYVPTEANIPILEATRNMK